MLYRHSEILRTLVLVADLLLVGASWLAAYWLRFTFFEAQRGIPDVRPYLLLLVVILPLWVQLYRANGLYEPKRTGSLFREAGTILRANAVGVTVLVAFSFFVRSYFYSRLVIGLFFGLATVAVLGLRVVVRLALRELRRRGHNLRYVVVVGAGELAAEVIDRLHAHPEAGLRVAAAFSDDPALRGRSVRGVPVVGGYADVKAFLQGQRVDQLLLALPHDDSPQLEKILTDLDDEVVSIRLVPDLLRVLTLRSSVEDLDGLPMINLREGPLVGWAAVQKRAFDVVVSALGLLVLSPLLALVALAILVSAGRPVLYVQERMGLDGRLFGMFKFRTMHADAEAESGPVWTVPKDPRRTRLGSLLRKANVDELPQLWNVLRGDMSLVGPRPERPHFIEQFRREIPGYMLRHKTKAGLTGWAQVHGWRGNTSLHERVEHDIYYIQNWSLGLDVRILAMTLWRGFFHRNAY
jgi:Undecaprenyl-phosphate glucose phosphotransferase